MKKILLAAIISIACTSVIAKSNENVDFLQKPTVNTSILNISNKGSTFQTKCEAKCNDQFRSCMLVGNPWHICDQQRSLCLFGPNGCYGI